MSDRISEEYLAQNIEYIKQLAERRMIENRKSDHGGYLSGSSQVNNINGSMSLNKKQ